MMAPKPAGNRDAAPRIERHSPPRPADRPLHVLAWPAFSNRAANPYNWLLYSALSRAGVEVDEGTRWKALTTSVDIVHFHWPDGSMNVRSTARAAARLADLLTQVTVARLRGAKVVWTAHNAGSHGRMHPVLERFMWWAFTRLVDGVIGLSQASLDLVLQSHPALARTRTFLIPHGHYRDVYPATLSPQAARAELDIRPDAHVLVCFGTISRYKNVPRLIEAFRALDDADAKLLIVGQSADTDLTAELVRAATGDRRIDLHLQHVNDAHVQTFLLAADVLVLPYERILNSGAVLLGLSFARPVLVPAVGAMPDLRLEVGDEWIRTYEGELTTEVVQSGLQWGLERGRLEPPDLSSRSWPHIADLTYAAYRILVAGPSSTSGA